jgi:hypothetical protein
MHSVLQDTLEQHGEVIAIMDSGEEVELHLGNTTFDEPAEETFTVEGSGMEGRETRYYSGEKIESIRLHYDM